MELSKRSFLLLVLFAPSAKAFSCTGGPEQVIKRYSEKKSRFPYIGTSAEEFLNQTYGENNWQYDDNLFVKTPEIGENSRVIPIETGIKGDAVSVGYTDLTIYAEEYILVGKHRYAIGSFEYFKETQKEKRVFEVAKYKFYERAYPYVSTRLNLSGVSVVRIFCVFTTNNKDWVRVIWQPKPIHTNDEPCTYIIYEKD